MIFFASKPAFINYFKNSEDVLECCNFFNIFNSVETLDELLSETKKLNQAVQLKDEKIKALENK